MKVNPMSALMLGERWPENKWEEHCFKKWESIRMYALSGRMPRWYRQRLLQRECERRYDETPKGRARKFLYEKTIRAAMRAPKPSMVSVPLAPNPFGCALGSEDGRIGRVRYQLVFAGPTHYPHLPFGTRQPSRTPPDPFDIRAVYAEQIRKERARGVLTPMTFMELLGHPNDPQS